MPDSVVKSLAGRGCHSDLAMGFRWIMQAVASGHPIVIQELRSLGFDVSLLYEGYRRSQHIWSRATGNHFGGAFDRIFGDAKRTIMPVPPKEHDEE